MSRDETERPDGENPTSVELEELVAYHEGRLTPAEEDVVRAKLVASPEAVDQLLALNDVSSKSVAQRGVAQRGVAQPDSSAGEGPSPSDIDAAWANVAARLNDREGVVPKLEERVQAPVPAEGPGRAFRLAASLAVAVLGLGLICAWLWLDRRSLVMDRDTLQRQVAVLSGPQVNVAVVELYPPGWVRGSSEGGGFDLPADAAIVHILLNLPQPAAGESFSLRISNFADITIWQADGLVATIENTVGFALRTELLEPGRYRLELMPEEGSSGTSIARYQLEID